MRKIVQTTEEKYQTMTETPVKRLIIRLAIPTIISMMITSIYNTADTFFVGQLENVSATAAVGVGYPLMAVIQAFGFLFGQGSGNFISRALGRQETEEAERMAATGFVSAFLAGLVIMALGLIFLRPLVRILGATDTSEVFSIDYVRWILIGTPWMAASLVLNNQLRFQGNALFGMVGITAGGLLNIALDPLFIFVLDMGVAGAALATILSQFFSFVLLFIGTRRSDNMNIHIRNFTPNRYFLSEMFKGGLPSLFRQGISSVATACLNLAAGVYGDAAVAAMSIVSRVMMIASSAVIGFGQGFQPVCGFNYGAKKYHRVREGFFFCIKYGMIFLAACSVLMAVFAPQLIARVQRGDDVVADIGAMALRLQCITLPLTGYITIANMMMQTTAQTFRASVVALARQGLFFLPLIVVLPKLFGLVGIQLAQPIADAITFVMTVFLTQGLLKTLKDGEAAEGCQSRTKSGA